jgi:secretion/DNA translocation related TadE-like protein
VSGHGRRRGRPRPASPRRAGECGTVTPLVATACVVIIMLSGAGSLAVSAAAAATQARVAADLSAVAGAGALLTALRDDRLDACGVARVVASRNGAALTDCVVDRSVNVSVEVSVTPSAAFSWPVVLGPARARARAGPEPAAGRVAEPGVGGRRAGRPPSTGRDSTMGARADPRALGRPVLGREGSGP